MSGAIERKIVIGLITSTPFIREVAKIWKPELLTSATARRLAGWCFEYFDKYEKAPYRDIEGIFMQKLKEGMPDAIADEIENDILPDLSDEFEEDSAGADRLPAYLLDQCRVYFRERNLDLFTTRITAIAQSGELAEAEAEASSYKPLQESANSDLELSSPELDARMEQAFAATSEILITYPGALGTFWNNQLVRGGFIGLLAPEKRGKTFLLMDMAIRGCRQGRNVAFFQAGDMTEAQQLRRIGIYLARRSDKARYCTNIHKPVLDCVWNQLDSCSRKERKCDFGAFADKNWEPGEVYGNLDKDLLVESVKRMPEYVPCGDIRCPRFQGSVWLEAVPTPYTDAGEIDVLTAPVAIMKTKEFINPKGRSFRGPRGRFKLSTHASNTLTIREIRAILTRWEKQEDFIPDVVVVDYADLLEPDPGKSDFRHQQNEIWKGLRRISQERHALVVTATQADANSYTQDALKLSNFSEDKRKYAHVTAMYGLNQDQKGREKRIGILRINELVVREDDFWAGRYVHILQCLQQGAPFLNSFNPFRESKDDEDV